MIYFDEKSVAEKMHDKQQFIKVYCVSELAIYAKWLRYKKSLQLEKELEDFSPEENSATDKEIERELIAFCEKCYPSFNYTINYVEIDKAIEISRKFKLKLPDPTPITKNEWETIMSVENDDYRRVLFVSLVDAKYYSRNHTTIGKEITNVTQYWNRMSDAEIVKAAKTKLRTAYEKRHVWYYLFQNGYTGISSGRNKVQYVCIVDKDSEVLDYVKDYDHLDLEYEKFMGENICRCKYCGKLFRQGKTNNAGYCYQHRGYRKIGLRFGKCIDCNTEFSVVATDMNKVRCDKCQKNHIREYDRKRKTLKNK